MKKRIKMNKVRINQEHLNQTIEICCRRIETKKLSKKPFTTFIAEQFEYLSPLFWVVQFAALVMAAYTSAKTNSPDLLTVFGPLTGLIALPELFRDAYFGMSEIEYSCRYSPAKLFAYRLALILMINTLVLVLSAVMIKGRYNLSFITVLSGILLPYNLFMILSFTSVSILKIRHRYTFIVINMVAAAIVDALLRNNHLFSITSPLLFVWILLSFAVILILIKTALTQVKGGHFAWN